jgi:hypothetical protein
MHSLDTILSADKETYISRESNKHTSNSRTCTQALVKVKAPTQKKKDEQKQNPSRGARDSNSGSLNMPHR